MQTVCAWRFLFVNFFSFLRVALSFIRALSTLLKCIAVQGVQLLCEFESMENIYSCHYLAWNAFTVKLIQLFRWKYLEGKEISMHSSRVWECESRRRVWECEWNMQANREKSALLHVHEAHTAYFWPLTHANGKISHIFFGQICIRLSMYVISLFGFFRALRCAFNGKWKWIMEHGIASCHRSRRRDWQKNF